MADNIEEFLKGSRDGEIQKVKAFLSTKPELVKTTDTSGRTALHHASSSGHKDVVLELLARGADVNCQSKDGETPLLAASVSGQAEVISTLLQHSADVRIRDVKGQSALRTASFYGHKEVVSFLLENGASVNLQDLRGMSALIAASSCGHGEVVNLLLKSGADVNIQNNNGQTALWEASFYGHQEVVSLLLKHGANVDKKDNEGHTALWAARFSESKDVIGLLLGSSDDVRYKYESSQMEPTKSHETDNTDTKNVTKYSVSASGIEQKEKVGPIITEVNSAYPNASSIRNSKGNKKLLDQGAEINMQEHEGETPLFEASHCGQTELVASLLKGRPAIDRQNADGKTALWVASSRGHKEIVSLLLQHRADINLQDKTGKTALRAATSFGHADVVSLLLKHGADVNIQDRKGQTALWIASCIGSEEIVSLLLQHGAKINTQANDGKTALWAAGFRGHADTVSMLIQRGRMALLNTILGYFGRILLLPVQHSADVNIKDNEGKTALHNASLHGNREIVCLLVQHGADVNIKDNEGRTAFMKAISRSHREVVALLVQHGADVNIKDNEGKTALHKATLHGNKEIVSLLVQHGADVNIQDRRGQTALWIASCIGSKEIVSFLLEHRAKINTQDNDGKTAIWAAVSRGHADIVSIQLQHGRLTLLNTIREASLHGNREIVSVLIQHGADVNIQDNEGKTALHEASLHGNTEIVTLLVQHGADVNIQDNEGKTALHEASLHGNTEIVSVLVQHGADVNIQDNEGKTALHEASLRGNTEIVSVLVQHGAVFHIQDFDYKIVPGSRVHLEATACGGDADYVNVVLQSCRLNDDIVDAEAKIETHDLDFAFADVYEKAPNVPSKDGVTVKPQAKQGKCVWPHRQIHKDDFTSTGKGDSFDSVVQYLDKERVVASISRSSLVKAVDYDDECTSGRSSTSSFYTANNSPISTDMSDSDDEIFPINNQHIKELDATDEGVECMQQISEEGSSTKSEDFNNYPCVSFYQCSLCTSKSSDNSRNSSDLEEDLNLTTDETVKNPEDISGVRTSFPIMCPNWQNSGYFGYEGGTLRSEHSDVELQIPFGAIKHDATVKIMSGVNVDFNDLYARLSGKLQKEETILSPLVEYYVEDNFKFETCVTILLPHLLPDDFVDSDVRVCHVTRNANNAIVLSDVPRQAIHSAAPDNAASRVNISFGLTKDVITVQTNHFSAVFCTYCNKKKEVKCHPTLYIRSRADFTDYEDCQNIDLCVLIWDKRLHIKDFMMEEHGINIMTYQEPVLIRTSSITKEKLELSVTESKHHPELRHRKDRHGVSLHAEKMTFNLLEKFGCKKCIRKMKYPFMQHQWGLELPSDYRKLREIEVNFKVAALPLGTAEDVTSVNIRVQKHVSRTLLSQETSEVAVPQSCAEGATGSGASCTVSHHGQSDNLQALQRFLGDQRLINAGASGAERNLTVQNNILQMYPPYRIAPCPQLQLDFMQRDDEEETTFKYVHKVIILTVARNLGLGGSMTFFLDLGLSKQQYDEISLQCKHDDASFNDTNFRLLHRWCQSTEAREESAVEKLIHSLKKIDRADIVEEVEALLKSDSDK